MDPSTLLTPETTSQLIELAVTYATRIVGALAVLAAGWILGKWLSRMGAKMLEARGIDATVQGFVRSFVFWGVVGLAGVATMSVFGVQTTTIAALVGGAGVGVGLALQGNLANLSSGLLLLVVRPFQAGDWVEVSGESGRVKEINLFTTAIDTLDNSRLIVPNEALFNGIVKNYEFNDRRRADIEVGVGYGTDLDHAVEVLTEALEGLETRLQDSDVLVRCIGFGGSSIDFKLGVWAATPDYHDTRHAMFLTVADALDRAGIEIPFPQRVLHIEEPVQATVEQIAAK